MKQTLRLTPMLLALLGAFPLAAQQPDTLRSYQSAEVEILGTRPNVNTPVTQQRIKADDLQRSKIAWDLPTLLSGTPSLYTISDAGIMGGYTSFSVRGVDPSRINITHDGVPLNDSESQAVFWANMPDFASRLSNIVVVRGVGASAFGAGAFGGTMDMASAPNAMQAGGSFSQALGMYGLRKSYLRLETGRLKGGFAATAHLSDIASRGYVDRSGGKGRSVMLQASWLGHGKSLHLMHNSGIQQTGIAWNGLSAEDEAKYGRTFNDAGLMNPGFDKRGEQPRYYNNTDNYLQRHTHLRWRHLLSNNWRYALTLHHTYGHGFTHEYRTGRRAREYALNNTKDKYNLIREKYLDNNFAGAIATVEYRNNGWQVTSGLSVNGFSNDHWGEVPYVEGLSLPAGAYPHEYYRNHSKKYDVAGYVKAEYTIGKALLYVDYMCRNVRHTMNGKTDKWNDVVGGLDQLDYNLNYTFHLPKAGIHYSITPNMSVYGAVQCGAKEPNRKAFTESVQTTPEGKKVHPSPEYLTDWEAGLKYTNAFATVALNGYYMNYKDQLVSNGQKSDVGEPILINIPKSYRMGVEAVLDLNLPYGIRSTTNATLSQNKAVNFNAVVDGHSFHYEKPDLSQSPSVLFNQMLSWTPVDALTLQCHVQYVGKRYIDNTQTEQATVPAYCITNLGGYYTWALGGNRQLRVALQVNNLLNKKYATNAFQDVWVEMHDGKPTLQYWIGYQNAAPLHLLGSVTLDF